MNKKILKIALIVIIIMLGFVLDVSAEEIGNASWYGDAFHGKKTASGETFNMYDYTAAHRTYEFGTKIRITNMENDKYVIVRVNDRGPYVGNRLVDLSKKAFASIASLDEGIIRVKVEKVGDDTSSDDSSDDITIINNTNNSSNNDVDLTEEEQEDPNKTYYYRIQFGAFAIKENAIKEAKKLMNMDISTKVYKVKYKSGKILYKVISNEKYSSENNARYKISQYKSIGIDCFLIKIDS